MTELRDALMRDLGRAGVDTSALTLVVRPYSGRYLGRYLFAESKAYVYACEDRDGRRPRPYCLLLETAIHEAAHHLMSLCGPVARGETHSGEFWRIYYKYIGRAEELGLFDPPYRSAVRPFLTRRGGRCTIRRTQERRHAART